MSMSQIALAKIANLTLAQLILSENKKNLPATFSFHSDTLRISNAIINSGMVKELNQIRENVETRTKQDIELVVFSTITVQTLFDLTKSCNLTINSCDVINTRVGKTSIRFSISCEDIQFSRQQLALMNAAVGIESAIVKSPPVISQPGLLVMDMDSTAIKIECIDEIAILAGTGEQVAKVTEQAMQGKLDFKQSLYQRVATLEGADETILQTVLDELPLMDGLTQLVDELRNHGWRLAIASGGFTYFADHLKNTLPLDAAYSNTLEIIDGKLTGKVLGDIVDANRKAEILITLADEYQISNTQTVAIGDGANDLVMMESAQLGVACHAKEIVKQKAQTSINKAPLHTLLHWLG